MRPPVRVVDVAPEVPRRMTETCPVARLRRCSSVPSVFGAYAATLTASVAVFAAAATIAVLRHRVIEVDVVTARIHGRRRGGSQPDRLPNGVRTRYRACGAPAGALGGGLAVALVAVPLRTRVSERVNHALCGHATRRRP